MPAWFNLEPDKIIYNADQMAFLDARRKRACAKCKIEFACAAPLGVCPQCGEKGERLFDRLTIIAGRRFGKSLFGSIAGSEEATINNSIGWACAPTNPKLHRYVIPAFQKLIPADWVKSWSSEFLDLRLKNGSLIHFQTLEDPDQGRGQGLDWLWIDEVCELTQDHWNVISPSLADRSGVAFFTTSPRSYDWVYEDLYSPAEKGIPGYWGLHARTADNPLFQTVKGREYLEREKQRLPQAMYNQEYMADFVIFTGAVYGGHIDNQILHTDDEVKSFIPEWPKIDPSRACIIGLDSGADHPFGGVKIVSTEKGLVITDEYLERHRTFSQHASELRAMAGPNTKWAINKNERQPMIELGQHGIYCQPSANDVVSGTQRVLSWLTSKQLWFAEPRCPRTVKQMKAYRWADDKANDGSVRKEKVYKRDDELPDCVRYALMTWPVLPEIIKEEDKPRDISGFTPEMQFTIQRMRKMEAEPKLKATEIVGDFWN